MNWGTPAVAGRASPSHPAEVHAAERFSSLRPFTSSWVAAPLRRAGGKIDDGTFSILARDRHRDNGEVRRLGFSPIPGRRFNSFTGEFVSMASVGLGVAAHSSKSSDVSSKTTDRVSK